MFLFALWQSIYIHRIKTYNSSIQIYNREYSSTLLQLAMYLRLQWSAHQAYSVCLNVKLYFFILISFLKTTQNKKKRMQGSNV